MPRVVDKAAKREDLAKAAMTVFAKRGYHGATMEDVAKQAGVSKGSVYAYFDSKDELLLATADVLFSAMFDQAMSELAAGGGSIRDRIERTIASVLENMHEWADACLVFLQVWAEVGPDKEAKLRAAISELYVQSVDRLEAVLDGAIERGEAAPHPTRPTALAILASLDGMMLQSVMLPDEFEAGLRSGVFAKWCASIVPIAGEGATP